MNLSPAVGILGVLYAVFTIVLAGLAVHPGPGHHVPAAADRRAETYCATEEMTVDALPQTIPARPVKDPSPDNVLRAPWADLRAVKNGAVPESLGVG